jgi:hypothetical protein
MRESVKSCAVRRRGAISETFFLTFISPKGGPTFINFFYEITIKLYTGTVLAQNIEKITKFLDFFNSIVPCRYESGIADLVRFC